MFKIFILLSICTAYYMHLYFNPINKALIIVDMQNDFVNGTMAVPNATEIISPINNLIKKFNFVVWTQDWHPSNHISFWENKNKYNIFNNTKYDNVSMYDTVNISLNNNTYSYTFWPVHCIKNTWGSNIISELYRNITNFPILIKKGNDKRIDSYSAFFDNFKKRSTGLSSIMKFFLIKDIYIVGLAFDYCVKYTAIDSIDLGFNTYVILDGTRSVNKDSEETTYKILKDKGIKILHSSNIL